MVFVCDSLESQKMNDVECAVISPRSHSASADRSGHLSDVQGSRHTVFRLSTAGKQAQGRHRHRAGTDTGPAQAQGRGLWMAGNPFPVSKRRLMLTCNTVLNTTGSLGRGRFTVVAALTQRCSQLKCAVETSVCWSKCPHWPLGV